MHTILCSLAFKEDVWHQATNTMLARSWQQRTLSANDNPQLLGKETKEQCYIEMVSFSLTTVKRKNMRNVLPLLP